MTTTALHFALSITEFSLNYNFTVDSFHQFIIGLLLLLIFISFVRDFTRTSKQNLSKENVKIEHIKTTARTTMHVFLIFMFFDLLLEVYRFTKTGTFTSDNTMRILINLSYIIPALKSAYLLEHFSLL